MGFAVSLLGKENTSNSGVRNTRIKRLVEMEKNMPEFLPISSFLSDQNVK